MKTRIDNPLHCELDGPNGSCKGVRQSVHSFIALHQPYVTQANIVIIDAANETGAIDSEPVCDELACIGLAEEVLDRKFGGVWENGGSGCEDAALIVNITELIPIFGGSRSESRGGVPIANVHIDICTVFCRLIKIIAWPDASAVEGVCCISCGSEIRLIGFGSKGFSKLLKSISHIIAVSEISPSVVPLNRQSISHQDIPVKISQICHEGLVVHVKNAGQGLISHDAHEGAVVLVASRVMQEHVEVVVPAAIEVRVEQVGFEEWVRDVGDGFSYVHGKTYCISKRIGPRVISIVDKVSAGERGGLGV